MDRQSDARFRYERLKRVLSDEGKVRARIQGLRLAGILAVGGLVSVPVIRWDPGLASVAGPEFFRTPTPHEAYLLQLPRSTTLDGDSSGTSAARAWAEASIRAIDFPTPVGAAYREIGGFPASPPQALGLQVQIPEGQRLRLRVQGEEAGSTPSEQVFVDVYRSSPEDLRGTVLPENPRPALLRGDVMEGGDWSFDAEETGRYVVRIQPEHGGLQRYDLSVQIGAPWRFPVAGAGEGDIGSFFGDSRDGGRRDHHGVDIFARRGTPVLAAADGLVRRVDTTEIGGRVVWQREAEGRHSIYYAHLDEILVRDGQRLQAGDTVGLVGNTGNARTTPPHLHFGAYRRGPTDPWNLILPIPPETPRPVYRVLRSDGNWTVVDEGSPAWLNAGGT